MATSRHADRDDDQDLEATPLSKVRPRETRFLVDPFLPVGALTLLEGDPASGKSYVAAAFGAALTRGRHLTSASARYRQRLQAEPSST
jgi:hypothetical protein